MDVQDLNFEYLRYAEFIDSLQHPPNYIKEGTGLKAKRRIFYEVPFDDFEREQIAVFKKELIQKKVPLPNGWTDQETLKYLYSAKFDYAKGIERIQKCLEWRNNPVSRTITPTIKSIFESGAIYTYGRDKQLRPVFVFDLGKIDFDKIKEEEFNAAVTILMDVILDFIYVPGKVENNVVLLDGRNLSLTKLPMGALKNFSELGKNCFPGTLYRCYMVGLPFLIKMSWKIIEGMMDKETSEKMINLDEDELAQIQEQIPASQLEKKFGGSLPNLTTFWPPSSAYDQRKASSDSSKQTGKFPSAQTTEAYNTSPEKGGEKSFQKPQVQVRTVVEPRGGPHERYTSNARIGQGGSYDAYPLDFQNQSGKSPQRVSQGMSYTPTRQRDEELIREILYNKVKPTPPRASAQEQVKKASDYSGMFGEDRGQAKQIESQLQYQNSDFQETSYREDESLYVDYDQLLSLNNPDMFNAIIKENQYLKHKNVPSENLPAEVDVKIKERRTIEAKSKSQIGMVSPGPEEQAKRATYTPENYEGGRFSSSPEKHRVSAQPYDNYNGKNSLRDSKGYQAGDDEGRLIDEWPSRKIRELPKPPAEDESDDDGTVFCGICVSKRKK